MVPDPIFIPQAVSCECWHLMDTTSFDAKMVKLQISPGY
ncbi:unnamed protein product [Rhodiola kirilowii]